MTDEMEELKHRLVVGRKSDGRSRYDVSGQLTAYEELGPPVGAWLFPYQATLST